MVIENCTTFTEDEIAHYSKIFETIQTIKKLINAKIELNNELNKTFVLRFLKLKKLREQIQNIDNELKALYKKLIHILVTRVMLRLGLKNVENMHIFYLIHLVMLIILMITICEDLRI